MKIYDFDGSEEEAGNPEIIWDQNDRNAIIAFLLLSVDRKMNDEDLKKLDAFMGIYQAESKNGKKKADNKLAELRSVRDAVIREGGAFLDSLERDESYCDYVLDEIDRVIEGNDKCGIGGYHKRSVLTWEQESRRQYRLL